MNKGLLSLGAAVAALCFGFIRFERSRMSSKEIPLIGMLAAAAAAGRVPFAAIPGVQPTTFIVVVSGFVFGPAAGFTVGAVAAFASNLFLGHGPWTVWQMLAWGACGAASGCIGMLRPRAGKLALAAFAASWGYLFGWTMNFWYWYSFIHPLTFPSWLAVNITSFPFDTLHAAGNAILMLSVGTDCAAALRYAKKRLDLSSIRS